LGADVVIARRVDGMGGQKKGKKNFKKVKGVASRGATAASTSTVAKKDDDDDLKCDGVSGVLGRGVATCCTNQSKALRKMCVPCYVKYVKPLAETLNGDCCPVCERDLTELLRPMVTESRGTFALDATREFVRAFRSQSRTFECMVDGVVRSALIFASMDVMQWITGDSPVTEFGDKFPSRAAIIREACKLASLPAVKYLVEHRGLKFNDECLHDILGANNPDMNDEKALALFEYMDSQKFEFDQLILCDPIRRGWLSVVKFFVGTKGKDLPACAISHTLKFSHLAMLQYLFEEAGVPIDPEDAIKKADDIQFDTDDYYTALFVLNRLVDVEYFYTYTHQKQEELFDELSLSLAMSRVPLLEYLRDRSAAKHAATKACLANIMHIVLEHADDFSSQAAYMDACNYLKQLYDTRIDRT
jgi:hypothetical protein